MGYVIWFVALVVSFSVSFYIIGNADEGDTFEGWRGWVVDCSIGVMIGCLIIAVLLLLDGLVWVIKWVF